MEQNDMIPEEQARWEFLRNKEREWQSDRIARREILQPILDKIEMQAEIECLHDDSRHGMTPDEWSDYQRLQDMRIQILERQEKVTCDVDRETSWELHELQRARKVELWMEYIYHEDWGNGCFSILGILRFKIERSLGYWEKADTKVWRQMRWAYQLLNIVIAKGNDSPYTRHMTTRVNMRNRMRFDICVPHCQFVTEAQRVRFCKAHRILFDLLEDNMLSWPDII